MKTYKHNTTGKIGYVLELGDDKAQLAGKGEILLLFPWIVKDSKDWVIVDNSLIDYLKANNHDTSVQNRWMLYDLLECGLNYTGTVEQDIKLLAALKAEDNRVWTTMHGKQILFKDVTQQHWSNIFYYHLEHDSIKYRTLAIKQLIMRFKGGLLPYKEYKPILFKTQDGVDVYKGDTIYVVGSQFFTVNSCTRNETFKNEVYFAKKENALEYAMGNKPMFSLQDVINNVKTTSTIADFLLKMEDQAVNRYGK